MAEYYYRASRGDGTTLYIAPLTDRAKEASGQDLPSEGGHFLFERRDSDPNEVRVIGDKADSLQKIPGSGTLVAHKEIDRAQPYDASEMLRRVPGVNVSQQEGGGLRLDMGIHGLDPESGASASRIGQVVVTDLSVAEQRPPERQYVRGHQGIDSDIDQLQGGGVGGNAQRAGSG